MLISMTGFGRAIVTRGHVTATVEIRSLNNRFCEISTRLPQSSLEKENAIKELVRSRVSRGKINVFVTLEKNEQEKPPLQLDDRLLKSYLDIIDDIKRSSGLQNDVGISDVLSLPGLITVGDEEDEPDSWEAVMEAVREALDDLIVMRKNEGKTLEQDIRGRILGLRDKISEIEKLSKQGIPQQRNRLKERIALLIDAENVNAERIEMEIAILADRLDVTEECVRFRSHLDFFLKVCDSERSEGRKLNFLLQEMNREANTIGSKCSDAEIAHQIVMVKEEIEKVREQVQNIE